MTSSVTAYLFQTVTDRGRRTPREAYGLAEARIPASRRSTRRVALCPGGGGYAFGMSDDTTQSGTSSTDPYDPDLDPDTDATMTAPDEGRPTGVAWKPDETTTGSDDAPPQNTPTDAEFLDAEEEEGPADE
jgi:hypothetical protein